LGYESFGDVLEVYFKWIKTMNWLKIVGVLLVFMAGFEMLRIITDYSSGKLKFWPFGADVGAVLMICLGIYLFRRGARKKSKV
jgi:hypothetical protein